MQSQLPPTQALRYFVMSAQHLSFTVAAEKLNISQAAISKQIKQLEQLLGVVLFHRDKQRITLTKAGRHFLLNAEAILNDLNNAVDSVRLVNKTQDALRIRVLPTICSRFLIPRLADLQLKHPDLKVTFSTELGGIDYLHANFDLAISIDEEVPNNIQKINFLHERFVAVASSSFIKTKHATPSMSNNYDKDCLTLSGIPLIGFTARPDLWRQWFRLRGMDKSQVQKFESEYLVFESFQLLIDATLSGLGAALIPEFMISHELSTGRLRQIHTQILDTGQHYFMAIPSDKMTDSRIQRFSAWLQDQAKDTV